MDFGWRSHQWLSPKPSRKLAPAPPAITRAAEPVPHPLLTLDQHCRRSAPVRPGITRRVITALGIRMPDALFQKLAHVRAGIQQAERTACRTGDINRMSCLAADDLPMGSLVRRRCYPRALQNPRKCQISLNAVSASLNLRSASAFCPTGRPSGWRCRR